MDEKRNDYKYKHKRPKTHESKTRFMIRQIMNTLFILLVIAIIAIYFISPYASKQQWFVFLELFTIFLKISEIVIQHLPK